MSFCLSSRITIIGFSSSRDCLLISAVLTAFVSHPSYLSRTFEIASRCSRPDEPRFQKAVRPAQISHLIKQSKEPANNGLKQKIAYCRFSPQSGEPLDSISAVELGFLPANHESVAWGLPRPAHALPRHRLALPEANCGRADAEGRGV